jgi:hypothetical protein
MENNYHNHGEYNIYVLQTFDLFHNKGEMFLGMF